METKPLHTLAFCLGRRLTDKELNIGHIVGAICKNLYKPEFKSLECMRHVFTDQQETIIGQRDKVEFEQQENV